MLSKAKNKHIMNQTKNRNTRKVEPCRIQYLNKEYVKTVDSAEYLGSIINRTIGAKSEIKRRIGLGMTRADDLRRLWRGTGISR